MDLAAELALPDQRQTGAAVLLHPHPLMGGDMHAPVPDHLFNALPRAGIAVLRFDFRGAGGSGGTHGGGGPETADVKAAVAELREHTTHRVWLVGWSFGAAVSLAVRDDAVAGWIAVAAPLQSPSDVAAAAGTDPRPVHLLVPEHDQFAAPQQVGDLTQEWTATELRVLPGADHFLMGHLGVVQEIVEGIVNAAP